MVEVIATIISTDTQDGATYPITRLLRFEFESLEAAQAFLDTSGDVLGLVDVEELGAAARS